MLLKILYLLFDKCIKNNEILNKYFTVGDNKSRLFNSFQLMI